MIDDVSEQSDMLHRHLEILGLVLDQEPVGIVQLSKQTAYAKHEVRYSLRRLEQNGLIEPTPQGARTTDNTSEFIADHDNRIDNLRKRISVLKRDRKTAEQT
ncbi:hypothetical protein [Halomicrococcus sp. NG-SE-24]|uniref:hypothetical protein n=1 Tax=Halomicrococcus sp. NG-SE-24 TaxID=3436928 RepID=UPI003D957081